MSKLKTVPVASDDSDNDKICLKMTVCFLGCVDNKRRTCTVSRLVSSDTILLEVSERAEG